MKIGVDLGGTNVRAALVDGTTVVRKEKAMHKTVQTFPYETAKDVKILFSEDGDMGLYGASVLDEK